MPHQNSNQEQRNRSPNTPNHQAGAEARGIYRYFASNKDIGGYEICAVRDTKLDRRAKERHYGDPDGDRHYLSLGGSPSELV
jgi:hypothetical protein